MNRRFFNLTLLIVLISGTTSVSAERPPVIDVHLHAYSAAPASMKPDWAGRERARALTPSGSTEEHLRETLAIMDRYNIVLGIVSGPEEALRAWHKAAPGRFIGGAFLNEQGLPEHSVEGLRRLVEEGVIGVFGELGLQYAGIAPDDPRLDPYYDYLGESSVPLALHTGLGPPGGPHSFAPKFRATLGRPTLFEPVIASRPRLKAYLMHAGWPYLEDTKAMLYVYPSLYVDVGVLAWALPQDEFYNTLKDLVDAGFMDRLLFGTDQMVWPDAIGMAIETVETVPFLSNKQKRDILYGNATRFLELTDEEISIHHGR